MSVRLGAAQGLCGGIIPTPWSVFVRKNLVPGIVMLIAAVTAGCSSSGTDVTNNSSCSVTLSGAQTGTYSCGLAAVAAYTTATNQFAIAFNVTGTPSVQVSLGSTGEPTAKTYANNASGAAGAVTVNSGNSSWFAVGGGGGTYSLVLSSVTQYSSSATGKTYTVHGSLDGTLANAASGGATVTVHATF